MMGTGVEFTETIRSLPLAGGSGARSGDPRGSRLSSAPVQRLTGQRRSTQRQQRRTSRSNPPRRLPLRPAGLSP